MNYVIVGLGNPGEEYEKTRHNVGRMVVQLLQEVWGTSDWRDDKKLRAKISQGNAGTVPVTLILPNNYMNRSGGSVAPLIKNTKQTERLIIVHDDIDLGIGTVRIVFNRGSGGHRGVASIERALRTREYVRVRIGVVPTTPSGKLKKPKGEKNVYSLILDQLTKKEEARIKDAVSLSVQAVESIIQEGRQKAMCLYNSREKNESK